jgi:cell division FtsZ-interacting protein ZapD
MNRRVKCQSYNRITGMICGRPATREAKVEVPSADGKIWETLDVCQPHAVAMRAELVKTINGMNAQLDAEIEIKASGEANVERAEAILSSLTRAEKALISLDRAALTLREAAKAERAEIARRERIELIEIAERSAR